MMMSDDSEKEGMGKGRRRVGRVGKGASYLGPLEIHGVHEAALEILDPSVLPFQ